MKIARCGWLPVLLCAGVVRGEPGPAPDAGAKIPAHPRELVFQDLEFTPPDRDAYRHVLPCGVVVYVVEDHDLPLVDVSVTVRTGAYLEPAEKSGLASLTGGQIRAGGTSKSTPEELDEELAFLAAAMSSAIGDTEGSAFFNCLTKDLGRVLDLFFDMLHSPRFDAARLDLEKGKELQELARRNDQTAAIELREWERLIRGADFFSVDHSTKSSISSITRDDLIEFHKRSFHPKHFLVSVSGDVKTQDILDRLESALAGWAKEPCLLDPVPPVPKPSHAPKPGTYLVDKPGVNQGRVSIGHLAPTRTTPDFHAITILNQILGGGGFTSRITSRVRSDEGLAYTAASRCDLGVYFDGVFRAYFQSKSESVAKATKIVLEEIEKIRKDKVTSEELDTAVSHAIGLFPRAFATPQATASTLANDEFTGRDPTFWKTYRQKMKALTQDDILRAAKERLSPEKLVVLIVGNAADILKGGLPQDGLERIPLPDPVTLEYPKS
jgi:zinc protease